MNVDECDGCELLSLHKQIVSRTLTRGCKLALVGGFFLATDDCGRWPELNYLLEQKAFLDEHLPETLQITSGTEGFDAMAAQHILNSTETRSRVGAFAR